MEGGEEKRRKVMTAEAEEEKDTMKMSTPLGEVEKSPMMSVYLIADLVGFPRPAGAAIYEVKISKTGGGIVVGDSIAVKPSELVFKFDMRADVVGYAASCGALDSDLYFVGCEMGRIDCSPPRDESPPICCFSMTTKKLRSDVNPPSVPKGLFSLVMGVNNKVYVLDNAPLFWESELSKLPFEYANITLVQIDVQYANITLVQIDGRMCIKALSSSVCTLYIKDVRGVNIASCFGL